MARLNSRSINRRKFLGTAAASALTTVGGATLLSRSATGEERPRPPRRPPNILFILTDDLGWGDLSIYGRSDYATPNLDQLARQGVRFSNAYAAQTVCTPTRVAFFTGRYPARLPVGLREPLPNQRQIGSTVGLPPTQPTLPSLLKAGGYETALIGKWHLGYPPNYGPNKSGFDTFFGHHSGGIDYFTHKDGSRDPDLFENEQPVTVQGYSTDLFTNRAVEFIKKSRNKPFYLSLHYNAPHWPWEGPNDEILSTTFYANNPYTAGGSLQTYAAMMKSLDDGIGKVLKALEETGQASNTLIIFVSDNGGERYSNFGPFSGRKGNLNEGGIRVPAIIRWDGKIKPNRVSSQITFTPDLTATILDAAGVKPARDYPLDGISLLPLLTGENTVVPRTIFWRFGSGGTFQGAARSGNWKYLARFVGTAPNRVFVESLYDLSSDPGEQNDLKAVNPQVFEKLRNQFAKWQTQVLPVAQPPNVVLPTPVGG